LSFRVEPTPLRGCQLINVALGGALYRDIPTLIGGSDLHADQALCDRLLHDIDIVEGSAPIISCPRCKPTR